MSYKELETMLCENEHVINCRPLVYLSDDDIRDALTPFHLLYERKLLTYKGNNPADTDVFKASSGHLKKVMTSCNLTRRRHDIWKKTSDLRRLEDV